jgi:hypothetical protein
MLIYRCCRLRSAVTLRGGEIKGANAVRAEDARECRATVHLFYCVIPHTVIVFRDSVRTVDRLITIVYEKTDAADITTQAAACGRGEVGHHGP